MKSPVRIGSEMRLRRPLRTKDQVKFSDAARRWVKRGGCRFGSGAGNFADNGVRIRFSG